MAKKPTAEYDDSPTLEDAPLSMEEIDVLLRSRESRPNGRHELLHFLMRAKATIEAGAQTRSGMDRTIAGLRQELQAERSAKDAAAVSHVLSTMTSTAIAELIDARAAQVLQEALDTNTAAERNLKESSRAVAALQAAVIRLIRDPDIPAYAKDRLRAHLEELTSKDGS